MNIRKLLMALACILCVAASSVAQDEINPTIVASMNKLDYKPKVKKNSVGEVIGEVAVAVLAGQTSKEMLGYENAVRAAIVQGMSNAYRLKVVDGLTEEDLEYPYVIYVDGDITNMTTTNKTEVETYEVKGEKKTRSRTYFRGQIAVTLQLKDAHDGSVVASPSFNITESDVSWIETAEGAMNKALEALSKKVRMCFNNIFPLTGSIIERAGIRNDKQKEVYIDLGSANGLSEGVVLQVFRSKIVAGRTAKQEIARLRVKAVEGDDVSLCKVTSHGKDLKAALDAGDTLIIETK